MMNELSKALKNMKNNETPGIDGFPLFWARLNFLILGVTNFFLIIVNSRLQCDNL